MPQVAQHGQTQKREEKVKEYGLNDHLLMDQCLIPLADMESRRIMKMGFVSCSKMLSKSTSSNVEGKRGKVTLKAFILRYKWKRLIEITQSLGQFIHQTWPIHRDKLNRNIIPHRCRKCMQQLALKQRKPQNQCMQQNKIKQLKITLTCKRIYPTIKTFAI